MKSELSAEHFQNEEAAFAYVEARLWPNGPVCPKCGIIGSAGRLNGKTTRPGLWKCYACKAPFTVRMGTIFESSHVPMRIWLQAFYLMCSSKKGIATRQLQRTFGGSMKTAWFLGHRIREAMKQLGFDPGSLGGKGETVEIDETYVGGKARNRKNHIPPKEAVVSLVERGGRVRSFHVPDVTAKTLKPIIVSQNHSRHEYVRAFFWHTNTVESYFSIFKRGIYGCYFHVSAAHLHRYAAEFDFRHNHRSALGIEDVERTVLAVKGAVGKRLTYRTVGGGKAAQASG